MRKVIIVLAVVLVVFALNADTATCEESQDIGWLDGTTWEKSQSPFKGSIVKVTVENGVGTGIADSETIRWKNIHVDTKGKIVLECLYSSSVAGKGYVKMDMKFKKDGKVMVLTPKEFGPSGRPMPPYEMKLVE